MIYKVYLPAAIRYGVDYDTFWKLNPRSLMVFQDEYNKALKQRYKDMDWQAWNIGKYVMSSIGAALNSKSKYPAEPMLSDYQKQDVEETPDISAIKFGQYVEALNAKFNKSN